MTKLRGRLPLREAVPLRLISRYIYIYIMFREADDVFPCENFFSFKVSPFPYFGIFVISLVTFTKKRSFFFFGFFDLERKFAKGRFE